MKDQFYIVLPSNSSMRYFADNTTTHFVTQLPQPVRLEGSWSVALTEIQIPLTFQHVSTDVEGRLVILDSIPRSDTVAIVLLDDIPISKDNTDVSQMRGRITVSSVVRPGIYSNIETLLEEINNLHCVKGHLEFILERGGYVTVKRICLEDECETFDHILKLPEKLNKILGFDKAQSISFRNNEISVLSDRPANLSMGLPAILMVYTDICEPYVTGDVHTRMLRAVPLGSEHYTYGSTRIKTFSPPMYLPLLFHSFQTIEIDIRDQHGQLLPFDCGTLTVTLHLKRTD